MSKVAKGVILLLMVTFSAIGQDEVANVFHKTFGGSEKDMAYSICATEEGGTMICGFTNSFGNSKEILLMKLTPDGVLEWSKALGGKKADVGNKIKPTSDGGYIIVGSTSSFKSQRKDIIVVKVDGEGIVEWSKIYGGEYIEYGFDIEQTSDDGYIIVGETNSFDVEDHDMICLKLDENGKVQWGHTYGDLLIEFGQAVHETEGGYLLAGETNSFSTPGDSVHDADEGGINDIMLMKVDYDGEVIWSNLYGGKGDDFVNDMIVDGEEGIVLLGNTLSYGMGNTDGLFIRTDEEGTIIQAKTLGNVGDEQLQSIYRVDEDGYLIAGFSNSHNDQLKKQDALLVRLTAKGSFRWSKTFGELEDDLGLAVVVNNDKEIMVAGKTNSFDKLTEDDLYLVKIKDERKMESCELSTVQVISIPLKEEEVHAEEVGLHHKKISPRVKDVKLVSTDIELKETVLCESDELLVETAHTKKKKKKSEDEFGFGDFGSFESESEEESDTSSESEEVEPEEEPIYEEPASEEESDDMYPDSEAE